MPGFVDTHRHAWRSLFRNLGGGAEAIDPAGFGSRYTAEDAYAATLVGLLGAIEAGVTTVVDWSDIQVDETFTDAVLQAHADSGARTVFVHADAPWSAASSGGLHRLVSDGPGAPGPSTTVAFGPADPATVDLDSVTSAWGEARELGMRIHAHVGSTPQERGIVSSLGGRGLLGPDVTLVHGTHLDGSDIEAISSSRAGVSLTPSQEMIGGHGAPPLQALIDRAIRPGLGVGDETEGPGDIFAQMRAANSLQHATLFDLKLSGKAGVPNLLSTRDVIRYGTIDGANAIGLGGVTGSLTPGKQADVIVLRGDRPNIAPINDPIGAVVWGMDTSNLDWVLVAGHPLMRDGALVADVPAARDRALAAHVRVGAHGSVEA
jgi:cytosine/adenosine deaminase-related metal-dependent hydrolase